MSGLLPRVTISSGLLGMDVGGRAVGRKLKPPAGNGVIVGGGGRRVADGRSVGESSMVAVDVMVGVGGIRVFVEVGVRVGVDVVAR